MILDVMAPLWPVPPVDAIFCANMLHGRVAMPANNQMLVFEHAAG